MSVDENHPPFPSPINIPIIYKSITPSWQLKLFQQMGLKTRTPTVSFLSDDLLVWGYGCFTYKNKRMLFARLLSQGCQFVCFPGKSKCFFFVVVFCVFLFVCSFYFRQDSYIFDIVCMHVILFASTIPRKALKEFRSNWSNFKGVQSGVRLTSH